MYGDPLRPLPRRVSRTASASLAIAQPGSPPIVVGDGRWHRGAPAGALARGNWRCLLGLLGTVDACRRRHR
jgi:hypothetical protein